MRRAILAALVAISAAACSGAAAGSEAPSMDADPTVQRACLGLGEADCGRAFDAATAQLAPTDRIVYAEVGPFGCAAGEGCLNTLEARPSGQITFERSNGEPVAIALRAAADGTITTAPGEIFVTSLSPSSAAGQLAGAPIPYSLGHCGLGSGIDVDGSWWDPIGFINIDHPDAINGADGTFVASDANHATYTSQRGFSVNLVRRVGDKHLPLCM